MQQTLPLAGYPGCLVSSDGQVYSNGKLKTPIIKNGKAPKIRLARDGRSREFGLAKLVATCFLPNPENRQHVACKDGNNQHCAVTNLEWITADTYALRTLHKDRHEKIVAAAKQKTAPPSLGGTLPQTSKKSVRMPPDPNARPVPGFPGYYATPSGAVYSGHNLLKTQGTGNRAPRVKLKTSGYKCNPATANRYLLCWVIAHTFLPNPAQLPRVICIDRDKRHCAVSNLRWVDEQVFRLYYRMLPGEAIEDANFQQQLEAKRARCRPTSHSLKEIDPQAIPMEDYPGYSIAPSGKVYKGNRLVKPVWKKDRSAKVRIHIPASGNGYLAAQRRTLGLAKLVAAHFVANPRHHEYVIFKDRDNRNCQANNLAWVDGETFAWYCGMTAKRFSRKIYGDPVTAARQASNAHLQYYYQTGDAYWLEQCWADIEKRLSGRWEWNTLRSDCYLYFLDRAKRFSILKDPVPMLVLYSRGLRQKLRAEISPNLPVKKLLTTDESLRITRHQGNH